MRSTFLYTIIASLIVSCNQVDSINHQPGLPKQPASVEELQAEIKNKRFEVMETGTVDAFDPNKFDWASQSKDTSAFYKNYMEERKDFLLDFISDSAVRVTDEKKSFESKYELLRDTSAEVWLNLHYLDSSLSFNPGEPMTITYTFKIRGAEKETLLLEMPREINRRKVVVLMKSNKKAPQ